MKRQNALDAMLTERLKMEKPGENSDSSAKEALLKKHGHFPGIAA